MKKIIAVISCMFLVSACSTAAETKPQSTEVQNEAKGNYTDEMKIDYAVDLSQEDGADSVEREGDHPGTPYFNQLDFYNMESNDTLTILPKFKTMQQTSEWSCGVTASLMVMNYFGRLNEYNEETLAMMRTNELTPEATSLASIEKIFDEVGGFDTISTFDYADRMEEISLTFIEDTLKEGYPLIIAWNDWGGHWQVIIGYDNMGTETQQDDVIIVADSYDTTDHNQDGYGIYPAERFFYNWTMYDFFENMDVENERDCLFLIAQPK